MSVQFTAAGIICNSCHQTISKLADFKLTMESHDCAKYAPQPTEPEPPPKGKSIFTSTPAERRNAKASKHHGETGRAGKGVSKSDR